MEKIVVIEDSLDYQKMVEVILAESFELFFFKDIESIVEKVVEVGADLVLLDVMVPGGDGFEAVEKLRKSALTRDVPILFVTGRKTSDDVTRAFNLGADDYITKPFDPLEFRARIEARLKKAKSLKERDRVLKAGNLILNTLERRAFLIENDAEIEVNFLPFEFRLLTFFIQNSDRNISRKEILEHFAKGKGFRVGTRSIDTHISSIRKKIPQVGAKIEAIYGVGYRFHSRVPYGEVMRNDFVSGEIA